MAVGKIFYRGGGGGGHDKENFSSGMIFLGYKRHFPEKWGLLRH